MSSASILRFQQEVGLGRWRPLGLGDADLIVAADGVNSTLRRELAPHFRPDLDERPRALHLARHAAALDAFTFIFVENDEGVFQVHATASTGPLHLHRRVRRGVVARAGLDRHGRPTHRVLRAPCSRRGCMAIRS
jgi:2-polyprenyl-6-methoxyphenol hydroxylase-like FAD-dependent oxidoreductase